MINRNTELTIKNQSDETLRKTNIDSKDRKRVKATSTDTTSLLEIKVSTKQLTQIH